MRHALRDTLAKAERAGIDDRKVVLDPGDRLLQGGRSREGLIRPRQLMPWHEWDEKVLAELRRLEALGRPLCVGLSRKSFLGKI